MNPEFTPELTSPYPVGPIADIEWPRYAHHAVPEGAEAPAVADEQSQFRELDSEEKATDQDDYLVSDEPPVVGVEESIVGRRERYFGALRRHKVAVAAGAITVASLAANPLGETMNKLVETAPYVAPGLIGSEIAWLGGAAMMLAAVGKKIYNPLKLHARMKEIPEAAGNSRLFKSGLAINTAAALAQFAVPVAAVTKNLPPSSWGILTVSCIDLAATVMLRRAIWRGINKNQKT